MSVDITLQARDRISQQIDNITKNLNSLNSAFEELERVSEGAGNTGTAALDRMAQRATVVGKGLTTIGSGLTKYITKPAIAAGTALAGLALFKGFKRFTQIDEAKAKLKALGNSAEETDTIMESARQAVLQTSYNLDEAATTAASAVAAGIKPGKDLTKYLSGVTDAAAIAGIGMDEMGSIFNKVAANGKATTEEINQLADRGIPIWQYLAKETGHSVEDVRKDLQAGKIDIKTFRAAIENNIGGASKTMGAISWSGMASNIEASIGRIGAYIWGATDDVNSLSGVLLGLGNKAMGPLDKIETKAQSVGQTIGGAARILTNFFQTGKVDQDIFGDTSEGAQKLFNTLQPGAEKVRNLVTWFNNLSSGGKKAFAGIVLGSGPALTIAGKMSTAYGNVAPKVARIVKNMGGLSGVVGKLTSPLGIGIGLFALMFASSEKFRTSTMNLLGTLGGAISQIFGAVQPLFSTVMSTIGSILGMLGDSFAPILDMAGPVLTTVANLFSAVAGAIQPIISLISKVVGWLADKIGPAAEVAAKVMGGAFEGAAALFQGVADAINAIRNAWDKLKSGTKHLNIVSASTSPKVLGGNTPKHATGVKASAGGDAIVGERGPELVNLPKGASVHPADETAKMGSNTTINVNMTNNVSNQGMSIDELISQLSERIAEAMSASAEGVTG